MPYAEVVFNLPLNKSFVYALPAAPCELLGRRVTAPFGHRKLTGFVIGMRDTLPPGLEESAVKPLGRVIDKEPLFGRDTLELARWVSSYYLCALGEALSAMLPSARREAGAPSNLAGAEENISVKPLELSQEQQQALDAIITPMNSLEAKYFYLYGITGSGKTEVFLRAAEAVLKAGKSVIYLVPEIALTQQTAELLEQRFGTKACAMHSRLSGTERLAAWRRIRSGEVRIVAGPRSAVFAPVKNLGLIIIDEEQDASYKAGNTPRYHARQVAMHRCSIAGDDGGKPLLLMGSATPSVEAWAMIRDKRITRLTLTKRLAGGGLPSIEVVNMARVEGCLSPLLKEEIEKTAEQGRQSILFLNRRGFAYFYHCPKCGYELTCKHCSVSLTWHKGKTPDKDRAVCHYCGFSMPPPRACPNCGSLEAGFTGFGTEMIEEEVRRSFPHLRVERADADSTAKKGALEDILGRFKKGEIDILLGTQMVAKGLNFPGVRLVGVVLADTGLHLPDFRAAERTFSLIVQVAGRAGRYFPNGKVVVQTLRPSDPAISCACGLEIEQYYSRELEQRKALNFPPYSRLIRFVVRGKDLPRVKAAVARLAERAAPCLPRDAELLGPAECPLSLIAGNYRRQIIIRGPHIAGLHKAAVQALAGWETAKENGCYLETDIDPVSLL